MMERLLGMYVHMHWGYKHPYAARTWTLEDWEQYLSGLKALGYNLVQIWPMIDTMPLRLTDSDKKHLGKIRKVIALAHKIGMTVYVGASANTVGNEKSADYEFENRPYFVCEKRLNPGDPREMAELTSTRRALMESLAEADGFWIIDSDPGGYKGSTAKDFASIFCMHRNLLDEIRKGIKLLYWVWDGWRDHVPHDPDWGKNPQSCWRDALKEIMEINPEPWGILACWKGHFTVIDELALTDRVLYFPYATVEDEPSFPWTNYDIDRIERAFTEIPREAFPAGAMGNAQSHCLQLPHTYLFQHFADGGTKSEINLRKFAEGIATGCGILLAKAWEVFADNNLTRLETIFAGLSAIPEKVGAKKGNLSGLCFGDFDRLIADLKIQIPVKIAALRLKERIEEGNETRPFFTELVKLLKIWQERHGFTDRYYGAFRNLLHPVLKELSAKEEYATGLADMIDGFESIPMHGAFTKLMQTLESIK
jgi:hypothetical protein